MFIFLLKQHVFLEDSENVIRKGSQKLLFSKKKCFSYSLKKVILCCIVDFKYCVKHNIVVNIFLLWKATQPAFNPAEIYAIGVILVSLLLTLSIFHTLF